MAGSDCPMKAGMRWWPPISLAEIFLCVAILGCPGFLEGAEDGWYINPALFYLDSEITYQPQWTGSELDAEWVKLNLSAGYSMAGGLLLGLKYYNDKYTEGSGANKEVTEITALGAGVGFRVEELALQVSVMALQAPERTDTRTDLTLSDGTGTMVDLMYLADLGGWYLGPQLTYRSFEYKKMESDNSSLATAVSAFTKATETHIEPYICFFFVF